MTKEEFLNLVDRYLISDISSEEEDILIGFFEHFQNSQEWDESILGSKEQTERELKLRLKEAMGKANRKKTVYRQLRLSSWYKIAAAIIVVLIIGFLLNNRSVDIVDLPSVSERYVQADLSPGGDIATLTLADGTIIDLSDSVSREIVLSEGSIVQKNEYGQLVYNLSNISRSSQITYNTLSTPKGGQYQVILPDGSKVWLNSETSMRFPTAFIGNERKVELIGEAYFEVAKDRSKQFKVNANGMEVLALGTEFNIIAYEGDEIISTTLFEGSVNVSREVESILLKPGQKAKLDKSKGTLNQATADLEAEIAWKNGYFIFNNEEIKCIMTKLSRWYDAEIEYEGNTDNKRFTAIISRRSNISEILEILENTGTIHFKIEGRRVKVIA